MLEFLKSATLQTVGSRFRDLCIVGLNRVELLSAGSEEPVIGDSWQDLTDEQTRRRTALLFFAPRELDGQPVSPQVLLAEDSDDEENVLLTLQMLGNMPLLDMCRISPAEPNTVNILVAADTIFHWDLNDNYVLPTTKYTWVKDVKQILKSYGKGIQVTIYTNWEPERTGELDVPVRSIRTLPLDINTWVNIPTFQEKNGTYVLLGAVALIGLVWGLLHLQNVQMEHLTEETRITRQKIPREGQFVELSRFMSEQEKFMRDRVLYPWLVQDVAHAVQTTKMEIENFEISNPTPMEPNQYMVANIEAARGVYKGWLQEEPIAKDVLISSRSMVAVRKPPGNLFKLEGLMDLSELRKSYKKVMAEREAAETAGTGAEVKAPVSTTTVTTEGSDS